MHEHIRISFPFIPHHRYIIYFMYRHTLRRFTKQLLPLNFSRLPLALLARCQHDGCYFFGIVRTASTRVFGGVCVQIGIFFPYRPTPKLRKGPFGDRSQFEFPVPPTVQCKTYSNDAPVPSRFRVSADFPKAKLIPALVASPYRCPTQTLCRPEAALRGKCWLVERKIFIFHFSNQRPETSPERSLRVSFYPRPFRPFYPRAVGATCRGSFRAMTPSKEHERLKR